MTPKFAVVNGPNLNWLGKREKAVYGTETWQEIWEGLLEWAKEKRVTLAFFQSNHEGDLIDHLQKIDTEVDGILFNPAAYGHTSIALRDCVASLDIAVVEVHLSKIQKREPFRHHSTIADVAEASLAGFGPKGYILGLELLKTIYDRTQQR